MDDRPFDHVNLHRQKVKALLALLVLSEGREQNIEFLERTIWPYSCPEKRRNNFNNLWSLLSRALTPDGAERCPYLVRHQGICKLDRSLVDSDIADLRLICEQLQFGEVVPSEAAALYRNLRRVYQGPVLPGERDNDEICRYRRVWRNRTIDALSLSAALLYEQEWVREALWFVEAALVLDPSREDILRLEMNMHLDQGNPSQALCAYSNTRRVLHEVYGLEPSKETLVLAERALGGSRRSIAKGPDAASLSTSQPGAKRSAHREAPFNPQRKGQVHAQSVPMHRAPRVASVGGRKVR
ncbi:MAG: AfsR/SARP family transcriptional regulator [Eggerthellaceae bacterium]